MAVVDDFKLDPSGFSFEEAKMTSVTLTDEGEIINITGKQADYGTIYLTYHLVSNRWHEAQGNFTGKALAIGADGARNSAELRGVWSRKSRVTTLYSLDDVSDGNLYAVVVKIDMDSETAKIEFTGIQR